MLQRYLLGGSYNICRFETTSSACLVRYTWTKTRSFGSSPAANISKNSLINTSNCAFGNRARNVETRNTYPTLLYIFDSLVSSREKKRREERERYRVFPLRNTPVVLEKFQRFPSKSKEKYAPRLFPRKCFVFGYGFAHRTRTVRRSRRYGYKRTGCSRLK